MPSTPNRRPCFRSRRALLLCALLMGPLALILGAGCAGPKGDSGPTAPSPPSPPAATTPPTAPASLTLGERVGPHAFALPIATAPVALVGNAAADLPISAAACGACHTDIYAEWRQSTHAAALSDPQYLAELSKPGTPVWLCLDCHTPLATQRTDLFDKSTLLIGADAKHLGRPVPAPNPDFDGALAREGITCATCHVRVDSDGRGTVIGPRSDGLAPHRVRRDPEALHNICARCHDPGPIDLTPQFTCWFETEREVAAGPLKGTSCPTCHMPTTHRPVALGAPARNTRRHLWVGGGPPKSLSGLDTLLERGFAPGFDLEVSPQSSLATAAPGSAPHALRVTLHNRRAGHRIPTGDPERFLRVWAEVLDEAGAVLVSEHRDLGQTWDFGDAASGRPARKLADNRLLPEESRVLEFALPPHPRQHALRLRVLHIRLTPDTAEFAAATAVPPEVVGLWPEAAEAVAGLARTYPKAMVVAQWRQRLGTSEATSTPPAQLIEASRALNDLPKAALKVQIGR